MNLNAPLKLSMEDNKKNLNKTPSKMARLAWPKSKYGVYAVLIKILSHNKQRTLKGAASIGSRPTFGDYEPNIEVFIFDFDENLYGEYVSISLVKFIRPELKFNSERELISQMKADCKSIEKLLDND